MPHGLPKAVFEYHLDTLTSRKQEYEFEHFCRKLAEKEICPNLRVQTGPTGGGDSKVDTETYQVAEEIAERWAFAFSAKKAWKPKVKADVDNILSTGRDYKRIYFFTNQFVRDKERSAQEDALCKHSGTPRAHHRPRPGSWRRSTRPGTSSLPLPPWALKTLEARRSVTLAPATRLTELEELDRQVADPSRYQGARYHLVEDCLRSAILARGLDRPRNEVESRFAQADRLAQDLDYRQQRLVAMLEAIAADPARQNNALQARTDLALMRITQAYQAGRSDQLESGWRELSQIVDKFAARDKALAAVERTLAEFHERWEVIRPLLLALQRLVWIELQLGRIPHVLSAMTLASLLPHT